MHRDMIDQEMRHLIPLLETEDGLTPVAAELRLSEELRMPWQIDRWMVGV